MSEKEDEHRDSSKPAITIGGNAGGQVGTGENVIQIGSISGGEVVFNPAGGWRSPAGPTSSGPSLPPELYTRLRTTLLACGPFADEQGLAALFVMEGLSQWRYDIPEADSAGERVERMIAWLWSREATGENGLVILIRVLASRYEDPAGCRQQLESLAGELALHLK